jgi:uncharacterized protein (UPF0332 family)
MKKKSDENFACAKLARKHGYYSAGMSRCFYSMFQVAIHYLAAFVAATKLDASELEKGKKRKGYVQYLLQVCGIDGVTNSNYADAMAKRKTADYDPDDIPREILDSYLKKADDFRKKLFSTMKEKLK